MRPHKEGSRRIIYIDKHTKYFLENNEEKYKLKDILPGDKLAIRYFSEDDLFLAEDVYLVENAFYPEVYKWTRELLKGKKRKKKRKKKEKKKEE